MKSIQQIAIERQIINEAIRSFFKERGYIEVETPLLVRSPGMESNLVPFETIVREPNGTTHSATLTTSPEYALKKLLGMGMKKVFSLAKVFRNDEEFGNNHNPEFTMLEWYQQGKDYQACMDETEALVLSVSSALNVRTPAPFRRTRVRDLFLEYVGIDLDMASVIDLKCACTTHQIHFLPTDTESDLFYRLFLSKIEPQLKTDSVFLYDYPTHQAAMSQLTLDGNYGQRFELYVNGFELCNGYTELTDAVEQRARFEIEAEERRSLGKIVHPIDENLLSLLPSIQIPTFGNALGVDRLHMILTGTTKIEDVILFPASELFHSC